MAPTLWTRTMRTACVWLGLAGIVLLQGCANTTSGGTVGVERKQLMIVSSEAVNAQAALGFQQLTSDALQKKKLNTDSKLTQRVRKIGNDLIAQVDTFRPDAKGWAWEINVFDSDEINAFCAPGGKIGVYTGIIKRLKLTDDELAAVMGHEIAHALREHSREQLSQKSLAGVITKVAASAMDVNESLLEAGAQMLVHLPNSRSMELESDVIGLELMARAGYDPRNASNLWKKMQTATNSKGGPAFLSTHPAGEDRIAAMEALVPTVLPLYEAALPTRKAQAATTQAAAKKSSTHQRPRKPKAATTPATSAAVPAVQ